MDKETMEFSLAPSVERGEHCEYLEASADFEDRVIFLEVGSSVDATYIGSHTPEQLRTLANWLLEVVKKSEKHE